MSQPNFANNHLRFEDQVNLTLNDACGKLLDQQNKQGYFCFELEADCTINSEYILMMHFLDDIDNQLQSKLANYIRNKQQKNGGWPLYYNGSFDLSCSVKAYYALKLAGDDINSAHMQKARDIILNNGGAAKSNVFTLITLALFEQVPWRATPFVPIELLLAPKWFFFHINKISYWSRTVMIPLMILCRLKAKAINPTQTAISELFKIDPFIENNYFQVRSFRNKLFLYLERSAYKLSWLIPKSLTNKALKQAENWMIPRLNGQDGLGAIFPAMVNALEALRTLGYEKNHPYCIDAKQALENLIIKQDSQAYCQPCVSPVWDSCLAGLTISETFKNPSCDKQKAKLNNSMNVAIDWFLKKQLTTEAGDWQVDSPNLAGGGWPFQFNNSYYPDLDDTAVVAMFMHANNQAQDPLINQSIARAANWLAKMQSSNGGFAAFNKDNTYYYLNDIPFADHGALLDPPTADVTARCLCLFADLNDPKYKNNIKKAVNYLLKEQETNGSWFGRWGTNYIYGTWSVIMAFSKLNLTHLPEIKKAIKWLYQQQNKDGGFGEDNGSYFNPPKGQLKASSTNFQTALAVMALMQAEQEITPAIKHGIEFLVKNYQVNNFWNEPWFTAPGFPRVFYLKYHGYSVYFPVWALAMYKNLSQNI